MKTFVTDELRFDVPQAFRDRTLNMLWTEEGRGPRVSLTITREPRTELPFQEQAEATLHEESKKFSSMKVVGRRMREAGGLEAMEAKIEARAQKQPTYSRQIMVGWYDVLLTFTWSSVRGAREHCDRAADTMLDTIKFRKK